MGDVIVYYLKYGGVDVFAILFLGWIMYLAGKTIFAFSSRFVDGSVGALEGWQKLVTSLFKIVSFLIPSMLLLGLALSYINLHARAEVIDYWNGVLFELDKQIFGVYVPFWLSSEANPGKWLVDALAPLLIEVYGMLPLIFGILLFIAFLSSNRIFQQMICASLLSCAIGIPFWYYMPALSPLDAFLFNRTGSVLNVSVEDAIEQYRPAEELGPYFKNMEHVVQGGFFAVTTMPSMHVAWGLIVLYFSICISVRLALFTVPLFLLNVIATMFTMQHYAVDIIAGLIVGAASIALAAYIYRWKPNIFGIPDKVIAADIQSIKTFFKNFRFA